MPPSETYLDSTYLAKTGGTWHLEDAPFKAGQVLRMLKRHPSIKPNSICDIGCGSGGVLVELERSLPDRAKLTGFEVSPQAYAISSTLTGKRSEFVLGDPFEDDRTFDLALVLDVVEHIEDCFAFLRKCAAKAEWKLYHIPLDASASTILRGADRWNAVAHLHLFTIETALKTVEYSGQEVVDWILTPAAIERPHRPATRLTNIPRWFLPAKFCARLLGGYSVMILAH